jgi:ATP-binding cassette, subfamily B, bacterial
MENDAPVETAPEHRPFTMEAMQPDRGRGRWKSLPRLTLTALQLVRRAAPGPMAATVVLQVLAAAALGGQLLLGRHVLAELISIERTDAGLGGLVPELALLMAAILAVGVIGALTRNYQRLLTEHVARATFDDIIEVSSAVDYPAFEDPVFHDQLERARQSGLHRPIQMVQSVTAIVTGLTATVAVAAALLALEPLLVPIVFAAGVPLLVATLVNSGQAYQFEYALTPQSRERLYLMQLLTERGPAKEVRIFGSGRLLRRRYDALTDERFAELAKYLRRQLRVALAGAFGTALGTAIALVSLAVLLATGETSIATAVTAGIAMLVLSSRVRVLVTGMGTLVESGMFLDDFLSFLRIGRRRMTASVTGAGGEQLPAAEFTGVRVEDLSFVYPTTGARVLDSVSLEVGPGEIVALVGENGCGKTTLIKLLCQLYEPSGGRIVWNGRDARDVGAAAIQRDMTVLFQDYVHYLLTVADNIALGRTDAPSDLDSVRAAAVQASADGFINELRHGYETRLGLEFHGGAELSIGQWQRLALARAFFRGGPFLVLDEPTASLDPRAEYELFSRMRRLAQGRSVLLVSHRFSSVRNADRIYAMREGRIVEAGTHDELMALDGYYAELQALQAHAVAARGRDDPEDQCVDVGRP